MNCRQYCPTFETRTNLTISNTWNFSTTVLVPFCYTSSCMDRWIFDLRSIASSIKLVQWTPHMLEWLCVFWPCNFICMVGERIQVSRKMQTGKKKSKPGQGLIYLSCDFLHTYQVTWSWQWLEELYWWRRSNLHVLVWWQGYSLICLGTQVKLQLFWRSLMHWPN